MAGQHRFRSGNAEGPTQRHHTFTDLHFARAGVTRAQDDQFRSLQIQERRFQAGENAVFLSNPRSSRREEVQTANSQLSTNDPQPTVQSLLTSAATRIGEEDGILTGLEASLLNLQGTELVILSACDSGSGEVKIGEGVMSLRRAFRIAGAETVLASHWPVNDKATSQLMTEFIRRWQAGEPRAKAWREAQLSLLRSKDFASPYFWAAFTLTGQWN